MNHAASIEHLPSLRDGNWLNGKRNPDTYRRVCMASTTACSTRCWHGAIPSGIMQEETVGHLLLEPWLRYLECAR